MEENAQNNQAEILEVRLDDAVANGEKSPSMVKDFFTEETSEKIKDLAELFGQSETELKKEFGTFKAKKVYKKLNYLIDSRYRLKEDLKNCLETALKYGFYGVTVYPSALPLAKGVLFGSQIKVRALINYPHGEEDFKTVKYAVKRAKKSGADEIAIMLSSYQIKNSDIKGVFKQVRKLTKAAGNKNVILMLDSANLSRTEIESAISSLWVSGIYSISIINTQTRVDRNVLDDALKADDDRIFIECMDEICCAEQAVSVLVSGIDVLTSEFCKEIVEDLSEKINASSESKCQPLDKTDKE